MDEGFHEFQLNGKQLVFLFMACTVVAVAIFLSGVLVGRSTRSTKPAESAAASSPEAPVDPTAGTQRAPATVSASSDRSSPASQETLTYPDRLEDPTPPPETLKPTPTPRPSPPPTVRPAPQPAAPRDVHPTTTTAPAPSRVQAPASAPVRDTASAPVPAAKQPDKVGSEPAGKGFVVQVMATKQRRDADALAKRLAAKGYPSFVSTAAKHLFRVRVGKYSDRQQAEAVKARLEKEEQFKPWVTR